MCEDGVHSGHWDQKCPSGCNIEQLLHCPEGQGPAMLHEGLGPSVSMSPPHIAELPHEFMVWPWIGAVGGIRVPIPDIPGARKAMGEGLGMVPSKQSVGRACAL